MNDFRVYFLLITATVCSRRQIGCSSIVHVSCPRRLPGLAGFSHLFSAITFDPSGEKYASANGCQVERVKVVTPESFSGKRADVFRYLLVRPAPSTPSSTPRAPDLAGDLSSAMPRRSAGCFRVYRTIRGICSPSVEGSGRRVRRNRPSAEWNTYRSDLPIHACSCRADEGSERSTYGPSPTDAEETMIRQLRSAKRPPVCVQVPILRRLDETLEAARFQFTMQPPLSDGRSDPALSSASHRRMASSPP